MASTEEKLLTLLLTAEHLKDAAKVQQAAVADSLSAARESLKDYRSISLSVAKRVQDEVSKGVQQMDVATMIGDRISADFHKLEKSVANMKANADALDKDISIIRSNIVAEYNTLRGYSWKWLIGVFIFAAVVIFSSVTYVKLELKNANNVSANNYYLTKELQTKIDELAVKIDRNTANKIPKR
ncbi:hypothetical protein ABMQ79_004871 [Salmonella enterica]|nr:hypothetical protein [Salmonella enterica]EAW3956580.1 hypothetical protein [Salmonella enterica subsp. enterica]EBV6531643.1 hypothetical protein [Salmonella enterica subsp. enterica serovar Oranienburg]EDC0987234.1 hypothetical protein [Salmonella enterica subsp. enterica serovar Give]EEK0870660.1 hypothetical protein [Salmonella enterica subsp. enterica serovar Dublin]EEM2803244.1 hypothetical protein [Salmonella enterica subsp. enterica serovar Rubislaw]